MRARYYDPTTGSFMTVDPLEASTKAPYSYAEDSPVNAKDPSGLDTFGACGAIQVSLFFANVGYQGCFVENLATPNSEYGIATAIGGGVGNGGGLNGGIGAGIQVSNASSIDDLNGPFNYLSAAIGFGDGIILNVFWGYGAVTGDFVWGADLEYAADVGGEVSSGISDTKVSDIYGGLEQDAVGSFLGHEQKGVNINAVLAVAKSQVDAQMNLGSESPISAAPPC